MAKILDGTRPSLEILKGIRSRVEELRRAGIHPKLALILPHPSDRALRYAQMKRERCDEAGIKAEIFSLDGSQDDIVKTIQKLNHDPNCHGIFLHLPLPENVSKPEVISAISPAKDVDGMHPQNLGRMAVGREYFTPASVAGIFELLEVYGLDYRGIWGILGLDNILGRPLLVKLLSREVPLFFSRNDLDLITRADILVADLQRKHAIQPQHLKGGAIVLDNGNNYGEGGVHGDVAFDEVKNIVSAITPVPGGLGPMTIAMLIKNTVKSAIRHQKRTKN
jgi:methylenetetrahydrofolate dehydrogenase (NADP+)/methenyltetrahydrofolate cyclohydrolase